MFCVEQFVSENLQDTLENKQHWIQPPRSAEVANFLYFICNRRLGFFNNSSDKINFWGACLRERSPLSTLLMAWLRLSSYDILVFENILLDCWIWTLRIWLLYDDSGRFSRGISILTRKCRSDDHFEQLWPSNSRAKRDIRWSTLLCALWAFCYSAVSL